MSSERYITTWRKSGSPLDWDHHVSESRGEVEQVVRNIQSNGVIQWHTFRLGDAVPELSVDWSRP